MISIQSIASYIPSRRVDVQQRAYSLEVSHEFLSNKLGVQELAVLDEEQDTSDMAVYAVQKLIDKSSLQLNEIDCIILCTQNPDAQGLPHTSAIVHQKLELTDNVACLDISLGCSGYVYGLNVAQGMMLANDYQNVVLITADPYSKIIDPENRDTALLFGDAATATWLVNGHGWTIEQTVLNTRGSGGHHIENRGGMLHMDGRQVFNFAMTEVPRQVSALLEKNNLETAHIDRWYLHQGSRFIVENLAKRMRVDMERVSLGIQEAGNTVSSSIPLMIEKDIQKISDKNIILSGFGVGLSWGTMLLKNTITN